MLQTGLVGLVLAVLFVLSGTLWIPIILHAFLDINSGRLAYGVTSQQPPPSSYVVNTENNTDTTESNTDNADNDTDSEIP